jgi:hypothetical protein
MIIKRWRTSSVTVSFSLTNGSPNISSGSTTGLINSMSISGTGIPAGTTISSITGASSLTMSANYTGTSGTQSLTFEGGFEEMYPKTVANKLFNNSGTDALFDSNQQLKSIYLPSYVIGSMKLVGSLTKPGTPSGPLDLKSLITGTVTTGYAVSTTLDTYTGVTYGASSPGGYKPGNEPQKGANYIGHYWVLSEDISMFDSASTSGAADWRPALFDDGVAPTTSAFNETISLEAGDWVIITGYNSTNDTFIFSVISNTYGVATTLADGVARLSSSNNVAAYHASTNTGGLTNGSTKVITEDNLFDMMGTGTSNIAFGSHTHGNITTDGKIGSTATLPLITTTNGVITVGSFGTSAGTFTVGNDSRLSDARTPTSHTHGNITNGGLIGTTANLPIITGTGGILQAGSFGTSANTFTEGNDARLSDSRTPLSHVHGDISNGGAITSAVITPGSGDHIILSDSSGSDALKRGIAIGTTTTTFLNNAGSWATPVGTTYAKATATVLGLVELFDATVQSVAANAVTTTASRTYGVQLNANDQMVVNVPWSDTNDQYTASATGGLSVTSNVFRMTHPFYAQDDAPATPVVGTIWFDL